MWIFIKFETHSIRMIRIANSKQPGKGQFSCSVQREPLVAAQRKDRSLRSKKLSIFFKGIRILLLNPIPVRKTGIQL